MNSLANYDSEVSSDEEEVANSIFTRHQRAAEVSAAAIAQVEQKLAQEEPLGLLGESPEFTRTSKEDEEENEEGHHDDESDYEKKKIESSSIEHKDESGNASENNNSTDQFRDNSNSNAPSSLATSEEQHEGKMSVDGENDNHGGEEEDEEGGDDHDNTEQASSLARSMLGKMTDEIVLPPEPVGECSAKLQERIANLLEYTKQKGVSFVEIAEKSKSFRNPSIYEKLVQFCKIDENGTNFPPEIYNPYIWGNESFYEELGKVQRLEMEKREKERKAGSSHRHESSSMLGEDREKRKSKWDIGAHHNATSHHSHGHHHHHSHHSTSGAPSRIIPATGALASGFQLKK